MKTSQPVNVGLSSMLTPDNCVLMLIDHQRFQVSGVKNARVPEDMQIGTFDIAPARTP